jgi:cell division transport system permease protein
MTNNTLLTQWYTHHLQALMIGLGDLLRKPFASLMTLMVIGVAMALPSGLYILLNNLQSINQHWNNKPSLSLYLVKGAPDYQITAMLTDLKRNKNIASVKYVSPKEGLETFKQVTQFKDVLADLNQNPLPGVIVVTPIRSQQSPARLQKLLSHLQQYPQVKIGQLDMAWVKRLYYIITIGERITYSLALLFGIGVLLIIGNTIRLTIQRHHEEMRILKLVGATDAFIRRPMLYRGLLYGFFGGIVAWILVALMLWWLKSPAQSLAQSYNHNLVLSGLTFFSGFAILFGTALLGLLGAWLAGHRQLRALDS